jgi:excinuclease ABC subunit A
VREDVKQRLAESFEAACAPAVPMPAARHRAGDGRRQGHLFSAKFACPLCDYSCPSWSRACSPSTRPWAPARLRRPGHIGPSTPTASCPSRHAVAASGAIAAGTAQQYYFPCWRPGYYSVSTETAFEELPRTCAT